MPESPGWFDRLEETRKQSGLPVGKLLERLDMSRATYYDYRAHPSRYPRNKEVIDKIAEFLGEDPAALAAEMAPFTGLPPVAFLEAAAARELNTRLYQQHVLALARVLGMSGSGPQAQGVDVLARLLRELLSCSAESDKSGPADPVIAVAPVGRGLEYRESPYQYQIYVLPQELAGMSPAQPAKTLQRTVARVNEAMNGVMMPVTREHSAELSLPLFRGKTDVLVYPGLLEMRPPELLTPWPTEDGTVLVTGIYYAGAPDVAALLARELKYGFSTFDQLARLHARGGLRGLPSDLFKRTIAGVAHAVLADQSATAGPVVWATDDPQVLLTAPTRADVAAFSGPLILLILTDEALDYAAYRIGCVDDACPNDEAQAENRRWLQDQQDQLLAIVGDRGLTHRTIIKSIGLPEQARRRPDGTYRDAVDAMFDQYVRAFRAVAEELRLENVLTAQVERLDRRVTGGNDVYAAERDEIQVAAQRVQDLRVELGLGRFLGPVGYPKSKPQFLLLFDSPDGPVVLKAYGRPRPGEAQAQRLWQQHGVRVVNVLRAGDNPTSWLLMPLLPIEPGSPKAFTGHQLISVTTELAALLTPAHRIGRAKLASDPGFRVQLQRLDAAITTHLGSVLAALDRHGYRIPGNWRKLVRDLCTSTSPSVLHGDLGGGNVVRSTADNQLWILDSCGYIGPPEFDAARWSARTGQADAAEEVLNAWLATEPKLNTGLARALLGLELLMEAGVREIVKDEQHQELNFPDAMTEELLTAANRLLNMPN